ncbi:hypothetical protein LPJ72_004172 [Coemansia sp. Benny D160-2]|nr:hypothetical protein LPJ72_004172 [Coemansia sp. Benny D160-2]
MDSFIATLKPQTVYLDGFDDCPSILSIPFYLWYENTVPADVLKNALFKTLEEFPILAGQLKTGSDLRSYVVIDKNHLNIPEYTDSFCNVHFQTLKYANFDVSLLPVDYSLACKCPAPRGFPGNRLKLAEFHVLRMKDNSGMCIFASTSHTLFDGYAYCSFMKRWADISKFIMESQNPSITVGFRVPEQEFVYDRAILQTAKEKDCDVLEPEFCKLFSNSTVISRWIAWFSPELRGRIFRYMLSSPNIRNYYVSLSSSGLESLVQSIQPFVESDISYLSTNDVITALGTVLFAQALHKTGRLNEEAPFLTNIIVDIRPRVKRLSNANYVGNAALVKTVASPLELLLEQSGPKVLAAVACKVRRTINGISERYCEQTGYLFNKYPGAYVGLDMQITTGQNAAVSTNHTRFNYYEMDFGSGVPELVRPAFLIFENDFVIMPTRPGVDGYELAFTMVPEVAKAMMEGEYWKYMY